MWDHSSDDTGFRSPFLSCPRMYPNISQFSSSCTADNISLDVVHSRLQKTSRLVNKFQKRHNHRQSWQQDRQEATENLTNKSSKQNLFTNNRHLKSNNSRYNNKLSSCTNNININNININPAPDVVEVHFSLISSDPLRTKIFQVDNEHVSRSTWVEANLTGLTFDKEFKINKDQVVTAEPHTDISRVDLAIALTASVNLHGKTLVAPLQLLRLPPSRHASLLFVPRPGVPTEVCFEGPCWRSGKILRVMEENADVDMGNGEVWHVNKSQLRKVPVGPRTLTELGGLVREVFAVSYRLTGLTQDVLDNIKKQTGLLKAALVNWDCTLMVLVGLPSAVSRARLLANETLKTSKIAHQLQERRERRLRLLAERREAYDNNRMMQFSVAVTHIGLVIGRQGEKLGRIAKDYQVEIRILPDNHGMRLVRLYGTNVPMMRAAKEELEVLYQEIKFLQSTEREEDSIIKDLVNSSGLFSAWMNPKLNILIICGTRVCIKTFLKLVKSTLLEASAHDRRRFNKNVSNQSFLDDVIDCANKDSEVTRQQDEISCPLRVYRSA